MDEKGKEMKLFFNIDEYNFEYIYLAQLSILIIVLNTIKGVFRHMHHTGVYFLVSYKYTLLPNKSHQSIYHLPIPVMPNDRYKVYK